MSITSSFVRDLGDGMSPSTCPGAQQIQPVFHLRQIGMKTAPHEQEAFGLLMGIYETHLGVSTGIDMGIHSAIPHTWGDWIRGRPVAALAEA
jgi:hypothetical protein